jgi:dTDP-3-amino-3,4,6-trideoxy-alpha-D-glucose transaminase
VIGPDQHELPDVQAALARVVAADRYILGPEVAAFEHEWADYCGARYCVGVASGTDALTLLLRGLPAGGRVLVPANTAPPTYVAICRAGLRPWFVDVGDDGLIDPTALPKCPRDDGGAAVALVPVHLYGRMVRLAPFVAYAQEHGLRLVEDACQAHGARSVDGHPPGALSAGAAFSFYPTKNLGALGDGGAVVTNDEGLAEMTRWLRCYGYVTPSVLDTTAGLNSRLDELQAAVLRARLPHLERRNALRRHTATIYHEALPGLGVYAGSDTNYHLLDVRVPDRDRVRAALATSGVTTAIHYPVPGHRQLPFAGGSALPRAERWCAETLSLPLWSGIDHDTIMHVCDVLKGAL